MKHILDLLDEKPFAELTAEELRKIEHHCKTCLSCKQAFRAARISFELLQAKRTEKLVSQVLFASPFFHTRVIAALNQEKAKISQVFTLWWRASAPLILLFLLFVISLLGLKMVLSSSSSDLMADSIKNFDDISGSEIISTEMAISNEKQFSELTNDQIFRAIYGNERRK